MKTYLDCIPCFFRQALEGARIAGLGPKQQKQIINHLAKTISKVSLNSTPPEIARVGYRLLKKLSPGNDPYKKIKATSNRLALKLYKQLKNKVNSSKDRLLASVELAIAGNIIDFGVKNNLNIDQELKKILAKEKKYIDRQSIFHYREFKRRLKKTKNILYLADNAGETVFDRILIEEIKRLYPDKIIYYTV